MASPSSALPAKSRSRPGDRPLPLTISARFYRHGGVTFAERQALNGLHRWQAEFGALIVAAPLWDAAPPEGWVPLEEGSPGIDAIAFVFLPAVDGRVARAPRFLSSRHRLAECIDRAEPLCVSIGGLLNDFGALGALIAHRKGRPYGVRTDRVESKVVGVDALSRKGIARIKARAQAGMMGALERRVISRATLELFHGADTFAAYAGLATHSHLVHDIHIDGRDHVTPALLEDKAGRPASRSLKIVYAERIAPMKGPLDWVRILSALQSRGIAIEAAWHGDGPLAEGMRAAAAASLEDRVELPGKLDDHGAVLARLREADLLLSTHRTRQSPRILIESLASGTSIVVCISDYASNLIATHAGRNAVPDRQRVRRGQLHRADRRVRRIAARSHPGRLPQRRALFGRGRVPPPQRSNRAIPHVDGTWRGGTSMKDGSR